MITLDNVLQKYDDYKRGIIDKWIDDRLEKNNNEGLKFIFWHTFPRGRRDELSDRYYNGTIDLLKLETDEHAVSKLLEYDEDTIRDKLKEKLTNAKDIDMVISMVQFMRNTDTNPYKYFKTIITKEENGIYKAYYKLDGIKQIGDKLATFVIRDIVLINQKLKTNFDADEYRLMFPVDTWVRQKGKELLNEQNIDDYHLKSRLIELCKTKSLTNSDPLAPLKLNVGLWWMGKHQSD